MLSASIPIVVNSDGWGRESSMSGVYECIVRSMVKIQVSSPMS